MVFFSNDWIIRIFHVYMEANRLPDGLANYVFSMSLGFRAFDSCPDIVSSIMFDALMGLRTHDEFVCNFFLVFE